MRLPKVTLAVLLLLFAAGNVVATYLRSTIPLALNGTVSEIELRTEKMPGVDDVYLITVGEREVHVDAAVAESLKEGDRVTKESFSSELDVNGEPVRVEPSRDFRRMLVAMPLVVATIGVILFFRLSRAPRAGAVRGKEESPAS